MKRRWTFDDTTLRDPRGYQLVSNMVPNKVGNYETAKQAFAWGSSNTVTGTVINADAIQKADGTGRLFACTATRIYEVTSSSVTDRSKGGVAYTTETMWNAGQYGDVTIYTGRANAVQASSAGAFADLAGTPPKAKYIATQSLAVALAAYNDGVNTYEDGIWISDIGDHATWTPSASNEAANFRLLQTPGQITGIVSFKGDFYVFKKNSLYRVSYVGLPIIWQVQLVSGSIGAYAQGLICVSADMLVFAGESGWYVFDGQITTQIGSSAQSRRVSGLPATYFISDASSRFDPISGLVHFMCPTLGIVYAFQLTAGEGFGAAGSYNLVTSSGASTQRALVRGPPAAVNAVNGVSPTDSIVFIASGSDSKPYTVSEKWGALTSGAAAYVVTNFIGDVRVKTNFKRILLLLGFWNGSAAYAGSCYYITSERSDLYLAGETTPSTQAQSSASTITPRFTLNQTTRFLALMIDTYTGPMEIEDIIIESTPAGRE
jgi:hypothetical protein